MNVYKKFLEDTPERIWDKIWSQTEEMDRWDELSDCLYVILKSNVNIKPNAFWLEGGSGTGRVSIRLSKEFSLSAILIDTSLHALKMSRKIAKDSSAKNVFFIVGSVFCMPLRNNVIDIIWSGGVLEHFAFHKQQQALNEFLRCSKHGGAIAVIVPNKHAFFYDIARRVAMRTGTWPFGDEQPLSHSAVKKFNPTPNVIFSACFFYQLNLIYVRYVWVISRYLVKIMKGVMGKLYQVIDTKVPGYFLVAIWLKEKIKYG